jgi:hypothetical protein
LADRADFFAAAAQIMRRILVDLAREACTSVEAGWAAFLTIGFIRHFNCELTCFSGK